MIVLNELHRFLLVGQNRLEFSISVPCWCVYRALFLLFGDWILWTGGCGQRQIRRGIGTRRGAASFCLGLWFGAVLF